VTERLALVALLTAYRHLRAPRGVGRWRLNPRSDEAGLPRMASGFGTRRYAPNMPEAMDMTELRRGVERIDLEHTLGEYEVDTVQIWEALELDSVEEAKAAIAEVLRALQVVSESGFPVGAEADLAELVGFNAP
jgi:hypothetical protein